MSEKFEYNLVPMLEGKGYKIFPARAAQVPPVGEYIALLIGEEDTEIYLQVRAVVHADENAPYVADVYANKIDYVKDFQSKVLAGFD